ncbi:hypothetical protein GCM10007304_05840 [Rhodococcoides trifolii]|uniref:DUF6286 domain-containing protein n=1 Tax=Rhodococcoides trifolii TaxID=908250 RepID=A0A917CP23_9NOCA|nr:DUF6286 domain-containing protein [Rhodococcus trifolii]GGF94809.1 hypothetical protein GCM10007304_05840 [Rhodococcus trifolii]
MADAPAAGPEAEPSETLAEPGERGRLTVKDRVVERIATQAMRTTDGVATGSSGLARRNVSRVRVSNNDSHVRAQAEIGIRWPRSAAEVAADAHENITRHLADAGVETESIDVRVTSVQEAGASELPETSTAADELKAALLPRARPAAAPVAFVLSLVLVALGVVAVRDALVYANAITGQAWSGWVADHVDGTTVATWMLAAGIAVAVVGLLIVIAALKPRAKRYRPAASPDTWVLKDDVRKVVRTAVTEVPGVETARVKVKKRSAKVRVVGIGGDTLRSSVEEAATRRVGVLEGSPSVNVSVKNPSAKRKAAK